MYPSTGNPRLYHNPEQDVEGGGGPITGRRSRKPTAAAIVSEAPSLTGKAGGLPGRRGRNDDEDVGFGVAMSQLVRRLTWLVELGGREDECSRCTGGARVPAAAEVLRTERPSFWRIPTWALIGIVCGMTA